MQHPSKPAQARTSSSRQVVGAKSQTASTTWPSDPSCLLELETGTRIVVGNAGDHPLVLRLLVQAYQSPLAEDFQSRLDEPSYEPCDRLLLRKERELIGHVQVSKQIGWFQGQRCPLVKLQDFVTLPEYRAVEFDESLLSLAESTGAHEGAILGVIRTDRPEWFEQHGWSCCRGQGHTRANTRAILSHFDAQNAKRRKRKSRLEVRPWRHFELDALEQLYQQLCTNMWGALQRTEDTWQWLVGRKAHDQILIATEQRRRPARDEGADIDTVEPARGREDDLQLVGYAIVRDSCIVEMLTLPGYSSARAMLVARACRDAIDRDHHFVSLHTPAADPMHELLVTAGGSWISDGPHSGGRWMLKLLSPERWVERFYPVLHERAREAGIQRPLEIDFQIGDPCHRLTLTRRSSRLEFAPPGTVAQVECDWRTFQDLLTSNLTVPDALAHGRLRAVHRSVLRTLAALFPPKLFWQSPFSLLRLRC